MPPVLLPPHGLTPAEAEARPDLAALDVWTTIDGVDVLRPPGASADLPPVTDPTVAEFLAVIAEIVAARCAS